MKYQRALALSVLMTSLLLSGLARAQSSGDSKKQQSESSKSQQKADLSKAQDVVKRITPATTQEVHRSTDTATDVARRENDKEQHRQKGSGLDKTNVPSPTNTDKRNNPNGDADVQRGYDKHQKEAEKKKNPGS